MYAARLILQDVWRIARQLCQHYTNPVTPPLMVTALFACREPADYREIHKYGVATSFAGQRYFEFQARQVARGRDLYDIVKTSYVANDNPLLGPRFIKADVYLAASPGYADIETPLPFHLAVMQLARCEGLVRPEAESWRGESCSEHDYGRKVRSPELTPLHFSKCRKDGEFKSRKTFVSTLPELPKPVRQGLKRVNKSFGRMASKPWFD